MNLGTGKCSSFGGPNDTGVGAQEGLSCIDVSDLPYWWFGRCFLQSSFNPHLGLARNLNPNAFYIAMRWAYGSFAGVQGEILSGYTREQVRRSLFKLSANGLWLYAQAADFGPNTDTGRLVDCSPAILQRLQLATNDPVTVELVE